MSFLIFFTENPDHEIPSWPEIELSFLNPYIISKFYDIIFMIRKVPPEIFVYTTKNFIIL